MSRASTSAMPHHKAWMAGTSPATTTIGAIGTCPGLARLRLRRPITCRQLDDQMVAMLAAILVDHVHGDAMGAGFEVARQPRRPDMRRRLGLHPRLLGRFVAGENLLDKRIGPPHPLHLHRRTAADAG